MSADLKTEQAPGPHKVSITGSLAHDKMDARETRTMGQSTSTFTVKSLKMIAATGS